MTATTSTSSFQPPLMLSQLTEDDLPYVCDSLKTWNREVFEARKMYTQEKRSLIDHTPFEEKIIRQLSSSSTIIEQVYRHLSQPDPFSLEEGCKEVWACHTKTNDADFFTSSNLKGIVVLKYHNHPSFKRGRERYLEVSNLLSNPNNLNRKNPDLSTRGVGSLLIRKAEERSLETNCQGVCLVSAKEAEGFYEKMGFQLHPELPQLVIAITADKIQEKFRSEISSQEVA